MIHLRKAHEEIADLELCLLGLYTAFFEMLEHPEMAENYFDVWASTTTAKMDYFRSLLEGDNPDTLTFKWALEGVWPSFSWDSTFRMFEASIAAGRWVAEPAVERIRLRAPEVAAQGAAAWTPAPGPLRAGIISAHVFRSCLFDRCGGVEGG